MEEVKRDNRKPYNWDMNWDSYRELNPMEGKALDYTGVDYKDGGTLEDGTLMVEKFYSNPTMESRAKQLGLPRKITGDPLGCGCEEATIAGIGEVVDGQLEADYMCHVGFHNYVLFRVKENKKKKSKPKKKDIKLDIHGNVDTSDGFTAGELETM